MAPGGGLVRLDSLVKIAPAQTASRIDRSERQRENRLRGVILPGYGQADRMDALRQVTAEMNLPAGYTTAVSGRAREFERTFVEFLWVFLLAVIFMYMILASQFESLLNPLNILLSLPLAIPFALFSLWYTGNTLNLYSALGILVLFGVVKKNSILQVDHMNALRREGYDRRTAILQGNRDRLRPILMTTLALVGGMLPLWVGTGPGSEERRAIAVVVIGGQTLSLLLTLLVTPVAYLWLDDLVRLLRWRPRARAEQAAVAIQGAADDPVARHARCRPRGRCTERADRRQRNRVGRRRWGPARRPAPRAEGTPAVARDRASGPRPHRPEGVLRPRSSPVAARGEWPRTGEPSVKWQRETASGDTGPFRRPEDDGNGRRGAGRFAGARRTGGPPRGGRLRPAFQVVTAKVRVPLSPVVRLGSAMALPLGLGMVALLVGPLAFYAFFTSFQDYDDEGYLLISLREYARGGVLYDEVYSQYGPAYFQLVTGLFRVAGLAFVHTQGRAVALALVIAAAILCAVATWRLSRSLLIALAAELLVVQALLPSRAEPLHPGALLALLLGGLILVAHLPRRPRGGALPRASGAFSSRPCCS